MCACVYVPVQACACCSPLVGWKQLLEERQETGRQMWWRVELAPWLQFLHYPLYVPGSSWQRLRKEVGPVVLHQMDVGVWTQVIDSQQKMCFSKCGNNTSGALGWFHVAHSYDPVQPWGGVLVRGHQQGLQPVGWKGRGC